MEQYSAEDLARAIPPILSLISKSEKAQQKLSPESWQHKMLADNLHALRTGIAFLNGASEGTAAFSLKDRESALRAFDSMIARTQTAQPKFSTGTAQRTLLENRLFALRLAERFIRLAKEQD